MRLPALDKIHVPSQIDPVSLGRLLNQLVENVRKIIEPLAASPRAVSHVQSVTLVAATAKVVDHLLKIPTGKTPTGWAITDIDAAATVRRSAWDDKTITLVASANCVVQLEVW